MKDFIIYVLVFVAIIIVTAIPISIYGFIFSDDSFIDILITSIMLATGMTVFAIGGIMLLFFLIYRGNRKRNR